MPLHLTLRVRPDTPRLRRGRCTRVLRSCFAAGKDRFGFRLVHFSIQSNHLHLIAEADDARALARGMQGLAIRCARRLNRAVGRSGKVFTARYHLHVLRTPTEVRRALAYVLGDARKHLGVRDAEWADPCSSAVFFEGWHRPVRDLRVEGDGPVPVVPARSWLLTEGWQMAGGPLEADRGPPGAARGAARG